MSKKIFKQFHCSVLAKGSKNLNNKYMARTKREISFSIKPKMCQNISHFCLMEQLQVSKCLATNKQTDTIKNPAKDDPIKKFSLHVKPPRAFVVLPCFVLIMALAKVDTRRLTLHSVMQLLVNKEMLFPKCLTCLSLLDAASNPES